MKLLTGAGMFISADKQKYCPLWEDWYPLDLIDDADDARRKMLREHGWNRGQIPIPDESSFFEECTRSLPFGEENVRFEEEQMTDEKFDKFTSKPNKNSAYNRAWVTASGLLVEKCLIDRDCITIIYRGSEEIFSTVTWDETWYRFSHESMKRLAEILGSELPTQWECPCGCDWRKGEYVKKIVIGGTLEKEYPGFVSENEASKLISEGWTPLLIKTQAIGPRDFKNEEDFFKAFPGKERFERPTRRGLRPSRPTTRHTIEGDEMISVFSWAEIINALKHTPPIVELRKKM